MGILALDQLADGDITKWDEILLMEHDTVMAKIWLNKEMGIYERRYRKAAMRNAEREAKNKSRK